MVVYKYTHKPRITPRHFTLIEMLVVIAIIGILAAMLMPALQKAMDEASKANCASNLRGIGQAYYLYAEDWSGLLPPPNMQRMSTWHFTQGLEKTFPHFLGPYMGHENWYGQKYGTTSIIRNEFYKSEFYCPDNEIAITSLTLFRGGYGVNQRVDPTREFSSSGSSNFYLGFCPRLPLIKSPGTIGLMSDRYSNYTLGSAPPAIADVDNYAASVDVVRHTSGANMLFADGHLNWHSNVSICSDFTKGYRLK